MQIKGSILGLILIIILLTSACQNFSPTQPIITQVPTSVTPATFTPIKSEKEVVIEQIKHIVEEYNTVIETEKNSGNYELITMPDGTEGFEFTGESMIRVYTKEEQVQTEIAALNRDYYSLVMAENSATPTPNPLAQNGELEKLQEEYSAWYLQELQNGSFVMVYSSGYGSYRPILIGDSYVTMMQKQDEVAIARAKLNNLPDVLIELDIQQIRKIENTDGQVKFVDLGTFPYYRLDLKLSTYETPTSFYVLHSQTHQIIEINPKQLPPANEGSVRELEKQALKIIILVAPEINLDTLTPAHGSKIGTYFFRWEDRNKPLMDDGRSYPFVQVGLNGNGELLNYCNTLPLAK